MDIRGGRMKTEAQCGLERKVIRWTGLKDHQLDESVPYEKVTDLWTLPGLGQVTSDQSE